MHRAQETSDQMFQGPLTFGKILMNRTKEEIENNRIAAEIESNEVPDESAGLPSDTVATNVRIEPFEYKEASKVFHTDCTSFRPNCRVFSDSDVINSSAKNMVLQKA